MDTKIKIRKATANDLSNILQCIQVSFEKYIDRMHKKPAAMLKDYSERIKNDRAFVLEYGKQFSGVIVLATMPDYVLLDVVAVSPAFQGKSLGKHLLQFAEIFTKQSGKSEIRVYTNEKMHENIAIYTHCGYEEFDRVLEDGHNRVYLRKDLSNKI